MLILGCLEEDIGSRVYKEGNVCVIGCFASIPYPIRLVRSFAKRAIFREAVFEVAADGSCLYGKSDGFSHLLGRISVSTLQIYRDRQVRCFDESAKVIAREV